MSEDGWKRTSKQQVWSKRSELGKVAGGASCHAGRLVASLRTVVREANFPGELAAVLLCGGRSSRMGANKALLPIEGQPLWVRQWRALREATGVAPFLSLRVGTEADVVGIADPKPKLVIDDGSSGPLGGILAALETAENSPTATTSSTSAVLAATSTAKSSVVATHLAVLAVDLPFVTPAWWQRLLRACEPARGAVGRQEDGRGWEPLAAIYPVAMRGAFADAKARGTLSLQALIAAAIESGELAELPIGADEKLLFRNWNTPEDVKDSST